MSFCSAMISLSPLVVPRPEMGGALDRPTSCQISSAHLYRDLGPGACTVLIPLIQSKIGTPGRQRLSPQLSVASAKEQGCACQHALDHLGEFIHSALVL